MILLDLVVAVILVGGENGDGSGGYDSLLLNLAVDLVVVV